MKKNNNKATSAIKSFCIHFLVWSLLFTLNYIFIKNNRFKFDLLFHLKIWSVYLLVFYLNYILLIPYLLLRKKIFFYVIGSLALLAGAYFIKETFIRRQFLERPFLILRAEMPPQPGARKFRPGRRPLLLQGRHRAERNMFLLYDLLIFFTASASLRFMLKWRDHEIYKSETEKEKIFTELSYLKKQINPHFLFNSLNNIYSLSISKSDTTSDAILKLSSILRYMLYETNHEQVTLTSEFEILKDYIELQKLRLTDKVKVYLSIIGNPENYKIEPLLLIPLVENAFKFGVDNLNDSFIDIAIVINDNKFELSVKNKIVRRPSEKTGNKDCGIGISNIKRRLDILYPANHKFETNETNDLFQVTLQLNLKS